MKKLPKEKSKIYKSDKEIKQIKHYLKFMFDRCWYCGSEYSYHFHGKNKKLQLEHIHGKDNETDLALACGNCNRAKFDQNVVEFLKWLAFIRSSKFQCFILSKLPKEIINQLENYEWDSLRKD